MKLYFSSEYVLFSNCIETDAVFSKTEMNNEWKVNFLQNTELGIQYTYSSKSYISHYTSKTSLFVWCLTELYIF